MMDLFEKNYELFRIDNPSGAVVLNFIDPSHLTITEDNIFNGSKTYYACDEVQSWFHKLNLAHTEVIYVFGLALGLHYQKVKKWLQESPERHFVFLEDDPAIIYRFLETPLATEILKSSQVHIYYFRDVNHDQSVFDRMTWRFVKKQIVVTALKLYSERRSELFGIIKSKLLYESAMKNDIVDEFLNYGAPFFKNYYPNLMHLHESYDAQALFGGFKSIPAIVCGAGPSLQKNLDILKTLSDRALIFAGGSAMNALNEKGFTPHFGAGIDPNPDQYKRYQAQKAEGVPFFYRNRLEHRAFNIIQGPRLYVKGAGGYPLASWVDAQLHIQGPEIEEGHNVVNFCAEIATALGCNPIIFVGLDLAYTDMKAYAEGVLEKVDISEDDIAHASLFELAAHLHDDIHGEKVYTLWKWLAESRWITAFANNNPGLTIVNASEGGIGAENIENITLREAKEMYLIDTHDLYKSIHDKMKPINVTHQHVLEVLGKLKKSLESSVEILNKLKEHSSPLEEISLSEEAAYFAILEIFTTVYNHVHPNDDKGRYDFLMKTAQLNLNLINRIMV